MSTAEQVASYLTSLAVVGATIVFTDESIARQVASQFAVMNREWWASPTEAFIYNEFADALREAFRLGVLKRADLLTDDARVLEKLRAAKAGRIGEKLQGVLRFRPESVRGFKARVEPKTRWLDPPVADALGLSKLSERG